MVEDNNDFNWGFIEGSIHSLESLGFKYKNDSRSLAIVIIHLKTLDFDNYIPYIIPKIKKSKIEALMLKDPKLSLIYPILNKMIIKNNYPNIRSLKAFESTINRI